MSYTLRVHASEAEAYTGLADYDEIRAAVEQEVTNTINELGSDILETGSEEERDLLAEQLTDAAMLDLWREPHPPSGVAAQHRLPGDVIDHENGRRRPGVLLSLTEEAD